MNFPLGAIYAIFPARKIFLLAAIALLPFSLRAQSPIEEVLGINPLESKARQKVGQIRLECQKDAEAEKESQRRQKISGSLDEAKKTRNSRIGEKEYHYENSGDRKELTIKEPESEKGSLKDRYMIYKEVLGFLRQNKVEEAGVALKSIVESKKETLCQTKQSAPGY